MYKMYKLTNIYKNYLNSWLILTCWKWLHILHHRKIWILEFCNEIGVNDGRQGRDDQKTWDFVMKTCINVSHLPGSD